MRWIAILFFICWSFAALAQDDAANEMLRHLWSPYCHGVSLLECTSSQAQDLRDKVRNQVRAGEPIPQIEKDLYAQFGDQLRMEPKTSGREALSYLIPWTLISILFFGLLFYAVTRKRRATIETNAPTPSRKISEEIIKEISQRRD